MDILLAVLVLFYLCIYLPFSLLFCILYHFLFLLCLSSIFFSSLLCSWHLRLPSPSLPLSPPDRFVWIMGVSIVYSFKGRKRDSFLSRIYQVIRRTVVLFALGILLDERKQSSHCIWIYDTPGAICIIRIYPRGNFGNTNLPPCKLALSMNSVFISVFY